MSTSTSSLPSEEWIEGGVDEKFEGEELENVDRCWLSELAAGDDDDDDDEDAGIGLSMNVLSKQLKSYRISELSTVEKSWDDASELAIVVADDVAVGQSRHDQVKFLFESS